MKFVNYFYSLVKQVPKGNVTTYGDLAKALGDIRASRAVGRMLNVNPYAPIVPCHRVVMSDGGIGGFGGDINKKIERLEEEGVKVLDGNIVNFNNVRFSNFKTNLPLEKLRNEQKKLRKLIKLKDDFPGLETIGGVDVAYNGKGYGACVIFDFESMKILERKTVDIEVDIPYIPTFLAFRELPIVEGLMKGLKNKPSLLLIDGNGVLHPYGMGIASHVGVKLNVATIGVAKKLLCGNLKKDVKLVGDYSDVEYEGRVIGYALKSSPRTKKLIYISPGHKISFKTALMVVKRFCKNKLPEPLREAHALATKEKNAAKV